MQLFSIEGGNGKIIQGEQASALVAACLAKYEQGSLDALYDLGVAFSTGSHGTVCDMIEAHKWFNIAASKGHEEASWCRADVADEMTAREIAEAQRRAREWLAEGRRQAA
ncbi:hypothetical protein [Qipengyuania qiaonensis]|uniref:Sel1 repeat family protein n=1 Tax=Qipengyuania qiaonensis TaxID=2867240 RepID=A0ABS7J2F6_9SPHN|nr:hypothetical protein [Qipengyuania qiaonensis]MBX7481494.1 hypothetical protein [Qipengyuania qiaonensis]